MIVVDNTAMRSGADPTLMEERTPPLRRDGSTLYHGCGRTGSVLLEAVVPKTQTNQLHYHLDPHPGPWLVPHFGLLEYTNALILQNNNCGISMTGGSNRISERSLNEDPAQ